MRYGPIRHAPPYSLIPNHVGEVHKLLGSMAADNQAQSSTITEITAAISAMDQSTQQNAAMVEETSAAARNLTTEVTSLAEQAAMFRTEDAASVRRAPRAAATRAAAKKNAAAPYQSPVEALPAMVPADVGGQNDWNAF